MKNAFLGIVIHGKKLGRTIGFPTANVALGKGLIEDGVYSLKITFDNSEYLGVGTYRESIELFEAHIFEFDRDIYDKNIEIHIIKKIRNNKKFESITDLKNQIEQDSQEARKIILLPTLDEIVLRTLNLYTSKKDIQPINLQKFQTPIVVGSGNGYYTGRILFRNLGAFFATESEIEQKLSNIPSITDVVVISASGEKHAPIILDTAKKYQKNTFLISSSEQSSGRTKADDSLVMPKIEEPYTYNTSTYFGYIFAENPTLDLAALKTFITKTLEETLSTIDFIQYKSFFIVLPDEFVLLREMLEIKFIELFGRKIARDVFTYEQMKHATTVVTDDNELFLCFGNTTGIQYGKNQVDLPIFDRTSYAAMMMAGYYLVGKIQIAFPPYFMESIQEYCTKAKTQSGFTISAIVKV
ncbi:hypothetical protein HOO68_02815 [Candidatus Gracilibacteria bacterium]|nr:hypothetical protein [Candidatus Gracilibacteria bacterium]